MVNHKIINRIDVFIDPNIDTDILRSYLAQFVQESIFELSLIDRILLSLKV